MTILAITVSLINAFAALLTGYAAYRALDKTNKRGSDGDVKHSNTPKARNLRSSVRSRRVDGGNSTRNPGKYRSIVSAYREGSQLPELCPG